MPNATGAPGLFGQGGYFRPTDPLLAQQRALQWQGVGDVLRGGSGAQAALGLQNLRQQQAGQELLSGLLNPAAPTGPSTPGFAPQQPTATGISTPQVTTTPISDDPIVQGAADAINRATHEQIVSGLVRRGLPEHVAQGFALNIRDESGFDPGINEISPLVPGSRGGFGLAQWTGPRRVALEEFAAQRGRPVSDIDTQLDFLVQELQGPEARAAQSILGTQDPRQAAVAVARDFLRPAPENLQRRVARYSGGQAAPQAGGQQIDFNRLVQVLQSPGIAPEVKQLVLQRYGPQKAPATDYGRYVQRQLQTGQQPVDEFEYRRLVAEAENVEDIPALQQNYNLAVEQGFPGTLVDYQQAIKGKGFEVTLPDGSRVSYGGTGRPQDGLQPSSPATMIATIDGILKDPALDTSTGIYSYLQAVPGTPQYRFGTRARQLRGQAFLQAFESLKGAGQITEIEGTKATEAIGRLDTAQSPEDYRNAVQELRDLLVKGTERPEGWAETQEGQGTQDLSDEELLQRYGG